jgi:hypothetical protein
MENKTGKYFIYAIGEIIPEDFNHILNLPDYENHLTRCIVTNNISDLQSIILRTSIVEILE